MKTRHFQNRENHSRNRTLLMIVCICAALGYSTASGYTCGDYNADGSINLRDAVGVIGHIFAGGPPATPPEAADANCDGVINIGDAVYLIRYVFAGGPQPCAACPEISQPILFEICYSNFAWGRQMKGLYIDSAGRVLTYSYDQQDVPDSPPSWWQGFTEAELMERYSHNPGICMTIPKIELRQKYSLVEGAALGELSPPVFSCADFGEAYFVAYIFQPEMSIYQPVLLELAGDFAQKNFAPEAEELFEWLNICGWENIMCRYPDDN